MKLINKAECAKEFIMQQWEYLTVQLRVCEQKEIIAFIKGKPLRNEKTIAEAVSFLDELGQDGWEMTGTIRNEVPSRDYLSEHYLFFKRSKASLTASSLRSTDSSTSIHITFQNTTTEIVHIYWVDYHGKEVFYRDLRPAESYVQQTYITHPWRIKDDKEEVLNEFVAVEDSDVIIIA